VKVEAIFRAISKLHGVSIKKAVLLKSGKFNEIQFKAK
jgi:hypothetical protein